MIAAERKEMMELAKQFLIEQREFNNRVNVIVNKLLSEADSLKLKALDEGEAETRVIRRMVHRGQNNDEQQPESTVERTGNSTGITGTPPKKGSRQCGICKEYGHNARTCPKADVHYATARGKKARKV